MSQMNLRKLPEQRNFQERWKSMYNWLSYDGDKKLMFCTLCKVIGVENAMTVGTNNFKTSTLTHHAASSDHQKVLIAPKDFLSGH
jgi:uridine phosphorylase